MITITNRNYLYYLDLAEGCMNQELTAKEQTELDEITKAIERYEGFDMEEYDELQK